jgi:predicted GH43/DUF377 family glycosyl hydrolase
MKKKQNMSLLKMKDSVISGVVAICLFLGFQAIHEIRKIKKETLIEKKRYVDLRRKNLLYFPNATESFTDRFQVKLPEQLRNVPRGESIGIVKSVKTLVIRNVNAPYNASLIDNGDGYLLYFRYDIFENDGKKSRFSPYCSHIGEIELDKNFNQTEKEFVTLKTGSKHCDDPRVIRMNDKLFVVYNDFPNNKDVFSRTMRIAEVNREKACPEYVTELDLQISAVEKNWTPFIYKNEGKEELYFEYAHNPHKILRLPNPKINEIDQPIFKNKDCLTKRVWPSEWGEIRGGTPAQLVDGEYLAFFHSSFKDKQNLIWYVMGAYTFESRPPFRITSISRQPILFDGIYTTAYQNTAPIEKRVIFPAGFVVEDKNGKEIIHLSCGENDSGIKIVTLNKDELFRNMRRIHRKDMSVPADESKAMMRLSAGV